MRQQNYIWMITQFEKKVDKMIKEIVEKIQMRSVNISPIKSDFPNKSLVLNSKTKVSQFRSKSSAQHYSGNSQTYGTNFPLSESPQKKYQATFVNIKNARYRLPQNEQFSQKYNIKDLQFPSFRTRKVAKGQMNTSYKSNQFNSSTDKYDKEQKKSNIKLSWNKYIHLNNIKNAGSSQNSPSKRMNRAPHHPIQEGEDNIQGWQMNNDEDQVQLQRFTDAK